MLLPETEQPCITLVASLAQSSRPPFTCFPGALVHDRDRVLMPSSVVSGGRLAYLVPRALLAATPRWLLSSGR